MNRESQRIIRAPHILGAVVLVLTGVRFISSGLASLSTDALAMWLILLALYVVVLDLAGPTSRGMWTGYIYFCLVTACLMFGINATLLLLVTGTALSLAGVVRWRPAADRQTSRIDLITEYLTRVGINGSAAIVGYTVFSMIGGVRPFVQFADIAELIRVLIANHVLYFTLIAAGMLVAHKPITDVLPYLKRTGLIDLSLQFAALLIPVVYYNVGLLPAFIIMTLILFQAVRFFQVSEARIQLVQRSRDVSTLSTLGQAISSNLSLDEVLAQVHTQLYELVKPTVVTSALYDDTSDVIEMPAVETRFGIQKLHKRKPAKGMIDWVIRHRKTLQLNTLETSHFARMGIDIALIDVQAFIGVPLVVGDKVVGALGVGHETDPEAFDTLDITVLQTIAAQAALAIRNANLYSRTLRLSNNMAIISQSMQQVMFNLDRDSLVQTACVIACQITGAERAAVYVVHERLGLRLAGQNGLDDLLPPDYTIPYRPERYNGGSRVEMNIGESDNTELRELATLIGFKAALEVPLRSSNTLVGVLTVYHDAPHFFENADINLLEMLANQVTAAFDNTDLLQALEMYASEQAQLVYLSRVSSTNLDLERVVIDLSSMLSQMMNMPRVDVAILRDDDAMDVYEVRMDETVALSRLPLSALPEIQIAIDTPQLANPYILYADDDSLAPETLEYMAANHMALLLIMPMSVSRQVIGVLLLSATAPQTVTDTTRRLLEMAIHQVSAQVHNARLYTITEEALSQQLEQLSLIEDISYKISQSLNVHAIADNVLDAVLRATRAEYAEILLLGNERWQRFHQKLDAPMTRSLIEESELPPDAYQVVHRTDSPREEVSIVDGTSVVCMPLLSGERPLGVLRVGGSDDSRLGAEELNFIRSLSGHTAVSIDNAFLLEERQFQVNALTSLRELSLEVVGSLDDSRITEAVLQTTIEVLAAAEAALYAYDTRTDEIVPMVGLRRTAGGYSPVEPRIAPLTVYEAISSRQLTSTHFSQSVEVDPQGNLVYPTVVAIPIMRHGEVTEVLVVGFNQHRELERRDHNFIELLAVQVASHLENVILNRTIGTSNKRMRAILDSTRDGIILLDNFGRILDANRQANFLLNMDIISAVGESFTRFVRQQFSDSPWSAQMLSLGTEPVGEYREIELPRGEAMSYLQTSTLPVRDANGANLGRLLSIRDITEDKQLSMMRESLQRMVIHDLRSPMGAIMTGLSFLQVLIEDVDPSISRDMSRTIDASLESADNLMRLMDTLRDIPRMKDIKLDTKSISIRMLVMKAYESLEALFKDAHIQFEHTADKDVEVSVDIDLMRRVLVNLLHNALKFTPENGTIMVATDVDRENNMLRVRVCDTGPGIPPTMRERIFGEFQQVEGVLPKRGGRGTGLGLTLCKLAVEAHGGEIWVASEGPLPGACFAFTLPLLSVSAEKAI